MMAPPFGLILANRAVVLGVIKARDLLDIAVTGEQSHAFDTVWVGDSLLAKPRLEAVSLLSALAGVTSRVRLGVGCLATFVHRHPVLFAQQWASLDQLSNGRAWLAVCLGGPDEQSKAQALEHSVMNVNASERVGRLEEGIVILRKLFAEKNVAHAGRFYRFEGVTVEPKPVQQPCPIWIASNPTGLTWKGGASASEAVVERSFRRVARYADGWMSNKLSPDEFRRQFERIKAMAREEGRDPARLGGALYHNININEDRQAALVESKKFLDSYYTSNFSAAFVEGWTVAGGPKQCVEQLRAYLDAGLGHMALRLTSWDQRGQLQRFLNEVAPGGRHPVGTHNALIAFADGAYIELIAFYEKNTQHKWWEPLQQGGGLVDFCMQTDDLMAETAAFRKAGVDIDDPSPLSRVRPDGYQLKWVLSIPRGVYRGVAPFLIQDETPREERVPRQTRHANGVTGIGTVTVAVDDVGRVAGWYTKVLGKPGQRIVSEE